MKKKSKNNNVDITNNEIKTIADFIKIKIMFKIILYKILNKL